MLSSMLFTVSRVLRVCRDLPDSDYLFMKVTDVMRSVTDHLNAYEDFTGLFLVGSDQEVVDVEDYLTSSRRNMAVEQTLVNIQRQLRLAAPGSRLYVLQAEEQDAVAAVGAPMHHEQQLQSPVSPQVVGGGVPMPVPIPVPLQMPMPIPAQVVTTELPVAAPGAVVAPTPVVRMDSVEFLFVPDA